MTGAQELPDLVGRLLQVGVVHQGATGLLSGRSPLSQSSASLAPALAEEKIKNLIHEDEEDALTFYALTFYGV